MYDPDLEEQRQPEGLRRVQGPQAVGSLDLEVAETALTILDGAASLEDLHAVSQLRLHKLRGNRRDQWSITINGPWRICFRFDEETGDAYDVEVTEYH